VNPTDGALIKTDRAIIKMVRSIALKIVQDYADEDPVLIGIMNGSFMFMADLVRALSHPTGQIKRHHEPMYPEVDFIKVDSYDHTHSTGTVNMVSGLSSSIENRHVIVVEDIVDTGLTLQYIKDYLFLKNPASINVAALLVKHQHEVDYVGSQIGDEFVFGYGLDVSGQMRSLNELRVLP
jgi:hypoxanthine phosphoribosyltransferase